MTFSSPRYRLVERALKQLGGVPLTRKETFASLETATVPNVTSTR